jgi:hypothetical protein
MRVEVLINNFLFGVMRDERYLKVGGLELVMVVVLGVWVY